MLSTIVIPITVGAILGFLSGIGIGGGTILILWLTQIAGTDPSTSRAINLLSFIVVAGIVSIIRTKRKQIPWRTILPAIISGCIAAGFFAVIGENINKDILGKIFGGLLLVIGTRELFYRAK